MRGIPLMPLMPLIPLVRLQLQVIQLYTGLPSDQAHRDTDLALVRYHLFHGPAEVGEGPLGNLHHLADQEGNLFLGLLLLLYFLDAEEAVHLFLPERLRRPALPHELDDTLNAVDDVRGLLVHHHFDQHVAREDLPLHLHFLPVLDLDHLLNRHQRLPDEFFLRRLGGIRRDLPLDERTHLVFVARGGLYRVPAMLHGHSDHPSARPSQSIRIFESRRSMSPIARPITSTKMMITVVDFRRSSHVGHETLRTSARTSRM